MFLKKSIAFLSTPCRIRLFSLGSVLILLLINIWFILRYINDNQCPLIDFDANSIQIYNDLPKKTAGNQITQKSLLPKYKAGNYEFNSYMEQGFNISFQLGRWDKSRTFKMYDFITVGKNFIKLSEKYSVCMATQSSLEKLSSITQVSKHWKGPISAAVYAVGDEEYFLLHWYITFLQKCFASVKLRVSFHLAVYKQKIPTGNYPEALKKFDGNKYKCEDSSKVLEDLLKLRSAELVKYRMKSPYPQNHLRNLARKNCQSENVFLTDIDIIPSFHLAEDLDLFLKNSKKKCPGKCAYVIPTYELDDRSEFPTSKKELVRISQKSLARPFHYKVFIFNQYATNFSKWESYKDVYNNEVTVSHNVTNFEFLYEPFYVAPDTVPEHDERFLGYGYTRNTQVYEMFVAGYQFQVLSPIFTIHWGLQSRKGRPPWRERQNTQNRLRFETFKREVFARYKKDPLKMIH